MKKIICIVFIVHSFLSFAQTTDASGKKQGYWKKKDERSSKLIYEGEFKDDKPVGKFKYYYPNDTVRAIMNFKNGSPVIYARLFHLNGKRMAEGKYVGKEIKDSTWVYYDESGKLISKEKYNLGKKDGTFYVYMPDGSLSEEKNYKMDVENGPFKHYFDGRSLREQGNYVNGQMEGRAVYYYPNGVEVAAGFYKNGLKNGPWIYREESGKVKEKELYKSGKLASKKETDEFFAKNKVQTEAPKKEVQKQDPKKPASGKNVKAK